MAKARNSVEVGGNRARMARSSECVRRRIVGGGNSATRRTDSGVSRSTPARLSANDARMKIVGGGDSATRRTDSVTSGATPARLSANDARTRIVAEGNGARSRTESGGDQRALNRRLDVRLGRA
jgi:hypothetical protein